MLSFLRSENLQDTLWLPYNRLRLTLNDGRIAILIAYAIDTTAMETIKLGSWAAFEETLGSLALAREERQGSGLFWTDSHLLFRGHGSSDWRLSTTLQRYDESRLPFFQYYDRACQVKPSLETHTDRRWKIKSAAEMRDALKDHSPKELLTQDELEYLAYLRHHGFPSPLLDWSRSPYVAAYFAYDGATPDSKEIAIYTYREFEDGVKEFSHEKPHVLRFPTHMNVHHRHYSQQSEYTMCLVEANPGYWLFADHDDLVVPRGQDILTKYLLPASEKWAVLKQLDAMNMNAFTLMGSIDSLMTTLAFRQFKNQQPRY